LIAFCNGISISQIAGKLNVNIDTFLFVMKAEFKQLISEIEGTNTVKIGKVDYQLEQIDDMVKRRLNGESISFLAERYQNEYDALDNFFRTIRIKQDITSRIDIVEFLKKFHPGSKLISMDTNDLYNAIEMRVQCERKHVFQTTSNLLLGMRAWCIECYNEEVRITIDVIKDFLKEKRPGSILLSKEIEKNSDSKVVVQCPKGHSYLMKSRSKNCGIPYVLNVISALTSTCANSGSMVSLVSR
jgi:hypothetical protein